MKNYKLQINKKGIATLEMLVALSILMLSITAMILVVFGNQSVSVDAQTNNEAIYKAQEQLENARAQARENFYSLLDSTATSSEDIYLKTLTIETIDSFTKKLTSRITWPTSPMRQGHVEFSTVVGDWNAALGGDTCSPTLSGDWTDPQLLGYADIVSNNGASDLDSLNKKIYLTSNPSSVGHEDFYIFDVNNPNNPIELSKINTGPGLEGIHIAGQYAYVANTSINAQLQIIDISNTANPLVVAQMKMPGVSGTGGAGFGASIFYLNKKIYLGLTKSIGPEFHIINVTNPTSPIWEGAFETNTLISQIYVTKDNIAYLAGPDNPLTASPTTEHLRILNVNVPSTISEINTYGESNISIQDGESLALKNNTLYLGRASDNGNKQELFVINTNNPSSLIKLGGKDIGSSIRAITLRSNYAFMVTSDPNLGFQIWDISNPSNITLYGSKNIQQGSTGGMDCEGNLVYIAQRSNRALQIIGPK